MFEEIKKSLKKIFSIKKTRKTVKKTRKTVKRTRINSRYNQRLNIKIRKIR